MKKSFTTLVVLTMSLFAGTAQADPLDDGSKDFYNLIETYRQSCATDTCQAPFQNKTAFDIAEPNHNELSVDTKLNLQQVAANQAQIWGDTILEGDYHSDGHTQLDFVASLYKNDKLIGYKISYSERAWYTGDCDFDGSDDNALNGCSEGRIQESAFVSTDFKIFFRDEDDFADFEE